MKKLTVFQQKLLASSTLVGLSVTTAQAAVPESVSTAMSTAVTDVTTLGGLALVAVIAAVVFKYMRRAL